MTRTGCRTVPLLLALFAATPASAQTAESRDQRTLEQVFITHTGSAQAIRGRLLQLGPDTLSVLTEEGRRDLPIESVLRIDRSGDSVKNGAVIGALIEAGASAVVARRAYRHPSAVLQIVVGNAVFGAMLGASLDALNSGRTTIYRAHPDRGGRPPAGGALSFRVRF